MINLYKKDEVDFSHNGLGSLDNAIINPLVKWHDNGAFTLEFKYPLFEKHGNDIENSSIIKASPMAVINKVLMSAPVLC